MHDMYSSDFSPLTTIYNGECLIVSGFFASSSGPKGIKLRTKATNPYNYDPYLVFLNEDRRVGNGTAYTDRLSQHNHTLYRTLSRKHFDNEGDYWNGRTTENIQAFLRDYFENPALELVAVIEYCNQASGYPVWRLDYFIPE